MAGQADRHASLPGSYNNLIATLAAPECHRRANAVEAILDRPIDKRFIKAPFGTNLTRPKTGSLMI